MATPFPMRRSDRQVLALLVVGLLVVAVWWLVARDAPNATGTNDASTQRSTTPSAPYESGSPASSGAATPDSGLRRIPQSQLPDEARHTLGLIRSGGPFPHDEDGDVFQNREGILPQQRRGYYREYTVELPGSDDRGPRRIVGGGGGDRYYTDDHYDSFRQIDEGT